MPLDLDKYRYYACTNKDSDSPPQMERRPGVKLSAAFLSATVSDFMFLYIFMVDSDRTDSRLSVSVCGGPLNICIVSMDQLGSGSYVRCAC